MKAENDKVIRQPGREAEDIPLSREQLAKIKWPLVNQPAIKFPVVALGASAGGVNALERLFRPKE